MGKVALQYMVLRNLDRYMQKNQTGVLSHTLYKSKLKMDKNINVSSETTKLVEENTGSKHFEFTFVHGMRKYTSLILLHVSI